MPKKKKKSTAKESAFLILLLAAALVLLLALFNLHAFFNPETQKSDVLGVSNQKSEEMEFWVSLLQKEPEYLPGWIELAKIQRESGNVEGFNQSLNKVFEIDPNFEERK